MKILEVQKKLCMKGKIITIIGADCYYFHSEFSLGLTYPNKCGQTARVAMEVADGSLHFCFHVLLTVAEALSRQYWDSAFCNCENVNLLCARFVH